MNRLQSVALGQMPADLVIRGGRVVRPQMGDIVSRDVAVVDDRVAALPEDADAVVAADTTVIDADDRVAIPGLIDAHTHEDTNQAFERSYPRVLECGVTAVITEANGLGGTFGAAGVEEFLAATADLPVSVFVTVPPDGLTDTFESRRASDAEIDRLCGLLEHERVVGVGEVPWIHVVGRDSPVERLYERARERGLPISTHGAGCRGEKLAAIAGVVDNDHEAITADGHVERVENGLHSIGRTGTIRDDVGAFAEALDRVDSGELSLCTDGVWPRDLLRDGHMNAVVGRAIEAGVDPVEAVRAAGYTAARHYGLRDRGAITPGSVADIVILDDLETMAVDTVVANGTVVVRNGEATPNVDPRTHRYPDRFYDSVSMSVDDETFRIPADVTATGRVRAIEYGGGLVSAETVVEPPVADGELRAAPDDDVVKATAIDRHPEGDGRSFTGFLSGYGLEEGAAATSLAWELPAVVCVGVNDADMHTAVARVAALGGGWAVVRDGAVLADLPAEIGAVAADLPVEETAARAQAIEDALRTLGIPAERPLLGLQTLTFFGVPTLKLAFSGYADVRRQERRGLTP